MIYQSSEIQGKRIKVGDDQEPVAAVACHDFWKKAPDDVLLEIFIRIPDCRSAVRSSAVCRSWHSLILRNDQFIPKFKSQHHQHQDRYPPLFPYTIMFRRFERFYQPYLNPKELQSVCQLHSEEWNFLHGKLPVNYLDFLPSPLVIVRASCNGLLLVSPGLHWDDVDHYMCNPITKQFVTIPPNPSRAEVVRNPYDFAAIGHAMICLPSLGPTEETRFKVVEVLPPEYPLRRGRPKNITVPFTVSVFCSETRTWERRRYHYSPSTIKSSTFISLDIVTCNGVLYWYKRDHKFRSVIYLDLLKDEYGAIETPPNDVGYHHPYRIGVVRVSGGERELRLIQVHIKYKQWDVRLKVWRLNSNNNNNNNEDDDADKNWALVHNKRLERPKILRPGEEQEFIGPFVHPTNGDFAIVIWGKNVFEYNLRNATCKKIDQLELEETPQYVGKLHHFSMVNV